MTTDQFVQSKSGQVFVRQWKKDTNLTPLVLVHDSLGCIDTWRDFPEKLSHYLNRTVIAYDRLGFGKSEAQSIPLNYGFIENETEMINSLTQSLGLKDYILFGYSVGGAMSLIAAKKNPHCKAVISESAQAFVEERTREGIIQAREFYKDTSKIEKLKKYHGDKTTWVLKAWIDTWLSDEFKKWSLLPHLPEVLCPVLIIHGDKDEYGSLAFPDSIATTVAGQTKKIIVANCGHIPHREHETQVLHEIKVFLESECP